MLPDILSSYITELPINQSVTQLVEINHVKEDDWLARRVAWCEDQDQTFD